tara:strand:+ start:40 stop:1140 length:1101 start_codon:yes stop_codon:yes gene_type:complete
MKIELLKNKVFLDNEGLKKEIHPFWLRERVNGNNYVDKTTKQRLFDPTKLQENIEISEVSLSDDFLDISFKDGSHSKFKIKNIIREFLNDNDISYISRIQWDSSFKNLNIFKFKENFFEKEEMYRALINFYQYGFVLFKNVPIKNNYIINFANSIGNVRRTNFGEYFDVKSKPNPNDLAYTSLPLAPHTDNPYRNPVPCIQILHCIENKVSGGYSTLVDGFTVTEKLKKDFTDYFNILSKVKVKFQFIDDKVILENWSELIRLDENKRFKQIRFSPRLDFVPLIEKETLDLFYSARKKLSELFNSKKYRIEFKLESGDLLMIDNYRLLHGRTSYDSNEGNRHLQGCYIDYDSTESKLKHLKRKFNI